MLLAVDAERLDAQTQIDPGARGRGLVHHPGRGRVGRQQEGLGQHRALVGRMGFIADERDRARISGLAHGQRGPAAGLARADHDN